MSYNFDKVIHLLSYYLKKLFWVSWGYCLWFFKIFKDFFLWLQDIIKSLYNSISSWLQGKGQEKQVIQRRGYTQLKKLRVENKLGDLTQSTAEVIVNPANNRLEHGGGACGAIFRAAGFLLNQACQEIMIRRRNRPLELGEVEMTDAFNIRQVKKIIHAPGPVWDRDNYLPIRQALGLDEYVNRLFPDQQIRGEDYHLYNVVYACLKCCFFDNDFYSIAIPSISSGIFRFPKDRCIYVMLRAIDDFELEVDRTVQLTNFDDETYNLISNILARRNN